MLWYFVDVGLRFKSNALLGSDSKAENVVTVARRLPEIRSGNQI